MTHHTPTERRAALRARLERVITADRAAIARSRLPAHVSRCLGMLAMRAAACRSIAAMVARSAR